MINSPRSRRCLVAVTSAALITAGLVAPVRAVAAVANLYLAPAGSDGNDCTSSVDPCRSIGRAMSLAAASGTTIHLAQGHYDVASPGSKHVTIVGVGADFDTGSAIVPGQGLAVDVDDPAGVLTLKSLALGADPFGAYVTNGTLNMSHVAISGSRCAIVMTGGRVTLTDSKVVDAGTITDQDCRPLADSPAAVTMNGGTLSLVRSSLTDTKDEPGIVINAGTFSATDSEFTDSTYIQSNNSATVQNAGGAATIKRSVFTLNRLALRLTGGTTTITDSTFAGAIYGIATTGVGDYATVLRSTFDEAPLYGPAALGADVLSANGQGVCSEQVVDLGYNYETGGSCAFSAPTSHNGAATMNLGAFAAHGGPTRTVAVSAPSALIDAIPVGATWGPEHKKLCPAGASDQRGLARPQGPACDAGAFEVGASHTTLTATPNPAGKGATVTLRAKITPSTGTFHDPDKPAGKVTFKRGTTTLCSGTPVNTSGVATCTTTRLPVGRDVVRAAFTSSSTYLGSAGSKTVTIKRPRLLRGSPQGRP